MLTKLGGTLMPATQHTACKPHQWAVANQTSKVEAVGRDAVTYVLGIAFDRAAPGQLGGALSANQLCPFEDCH